jgi:hypothetical protein
MKAIKKNCKRNKISCFDLRDKKAKSIKNLLNIGLDFLSEHEHEKRNRKNNLKSEKSGP